MSYHQYLPFWNDCHGADRLFGNCGTAFWQNPKSTAPSKYALGQELRRITQRLFRLVTVRYASARSPASINFY